MGDVITRFKLETTQYESKLRDATNGLKEVIHQTELAGNDFKEFSSRAIEAARALGQQATGATNAKDKVKELVSSYNEMAKTYNLMSDAMKKSEGGKALAASLEQLQQRIKDAKAEMNATPGVLDNLASKFTVNIDAIKLFNVGLQAAEGVLNVAKDAFFKNEEQLDEWGRIVESSKSLYSGFLDALNTGDISGYLTRIGEITKAAQDAYNALDALNTFNAFNQVNVEKTRTGMTESIADYRSGQGTKEQVKAAGEAYQKELRERQKLEKQAYLDAIKKVAAERGVNGQDLITALSGSYGSYESLKAIPMSGTRIVNYGGGMFGGGGSYEEAYPVNRQEKLGAALRKLNDTELQSLQALGAQAERTGNEIAQVDKQLTRVLNGRQPGAGNSGGSGGGKSTKTELTEMQTLQKQIQELEQEYIKLGGITSQDADKRRSEIRDEISANDTRINQIKLLNEQAHGKLLGGEVEIPAEANISSSIYTSIEEIRNELAENPIEIPIETTTKDVKAIAKAASITADVVGSIGDAFNAIEDPAAKVMGTVMQAIANVALGYAMATKQASLLGPWAWIAFAASGLATMITTISAIHSATGYAQGGIVQGNSYSGDNIPAFVDGSQMVGLNAGEVVLTQAMAGNLASRLSDQGRGMNIVGEIQGEKIVLVANRFFRRTGQGEIVTW